MILEQALRQWDDPYTVHELQEAEEIIHALRVEIAGKEAVVKASASVFTDSERLDWLESMVVEVRTPLYCGSRALFHAQAVNEDYEKYRTSLRDQIDAEIKAR